MPRIPVQAELNLEFTKMQSAVLGGTAASQPVGSSGDERSPLLDAKIWPLALIFVGYPVWWILGLASFAPLFLIVPMVIQLWRQRSVVAPRGFSWWLLFLCWVLIGVSTLWADAPEAVPDGGGISRLMVFGYRYTWYVAATVVLLWLANTRRGAIPFVRVARLVGWLFVFCVAGGLAGLLMPNVELRSAMEFLLPRGVTGNAFVNSLIHPELADVQDVLGYEEARPKAPFPYANSWGSVISLTLPFFLVGWLRHGSRWQRMVSLPVLALAAVPIVYSLNRGLWASLLVGIIFFVALQVGRGRIAALLAAITIVGVGGLALGASPLGETIQDRMANQHSNDRRGELLTQTIHSVSTGSPVIGFGSTRDVQGSFASIAGGSTPDCHACGVPPLGTQGALWYLAFAHGLVGALACLLFLGTAFVRSWRCRTTPEAVATCVLIFFAVQLFVYDTLDLPLFLVMIAIGLAWREQARSPVTGHYLLRAPTLRGYADSLRRGFRLVAVLIMVGAVVGLGVAALTPRVYESRELVLLATAPSHLGTEQPEGTAGQTPEETTIDTEAALVLSQDALGRVKDSPYPTAKLREHIRVTAEPNTAVLIISLRDRSPQRSRQLVEKVSTAYLEVRQEYLQHRRSQRLSALRERFAEISTLGVEAPKNLDEELRLIDAEINDIILTPTTAGEPLRSDPPREVAREYAKFGGSGAALGLLAGLGLLLARRRRRHRDHFYRSTHGVRNR